MHGWGLEFCHCWGDLVLFRAQSDKHSLGMVEKTEMDAIEFARFELTFFTAQEIFSFYSFLSFSDRTQCCIYYIINIPELLLGQGLDRKIFTAVTGNGAMKWTGAHGARGGPQIPAKHRRKLASVSCSPQSQRFLISTWLFGKELSRWKVLMRYIQQAGKFMKKADVFFICYSTCLQLFLFSVSLRPS